MKSKSKPWRLDVRTVYAGDIAIGGNNPIRIQSMTSSPTMDTIATVNELLRLENAGCEIIRITAPTVKEAENLKEISRSYRKKGGKAPLVADIHYLPRAAMIALESVEKVRINPGNFVEPKKTPGEYTESEYKNELERAYYSLKPFLTRASELGRSIRIGVNHGSLSSRILGRYGNTAEGMVQSALEFIDIFKSIGFNDTVISLKASNPVVMIDAYRTLAASFIKRGSGYPLHLGVTEAGDGNDGRIKSATGIGTLLSEGIGDTIRVSLTEDSVYEIPVARKIIEHTHNEPYYKEQTPLFLHTDSSGISVPGSMRGPLSSFDTGITGIVDFSNNESGSTQEFRDLFDMQIRKSKQSQAGTDTANAAFKMMDGSYESFPVIKTDAGDCPGSTALTSKYILVISYNIKTHTLSDLEKTLSCIKDQKGQPVAVSLQPHHEYSGLNERYITTGIYRYTHRLMESNNIEAVLLSWHRLCNSDDFLYETSIFSGPLLLDHVIQGIIVENMRGDVTEESISRSLLDLFQSTRIRINRADYISCPSCGRTHFNLMEVTSRIKEKTSHLKGVKIGIMGCIVNGPGEMADADFGYVGSGPGMIDLYLGQSRVKRNIPERQADQELINLIKENGKWKDPV